MQAKPTGHLHDGLMFRRRRAAGDLWRSSGLKTGAILVHDVDIRLGGERLGDEPHNRLAVLRHTRHHQMSDDEAALGDAMRIKQQVTDLAVHLLDDRAHHLGVVALPHRGSARWQRDQET